MKKICLLMMVLTIFIVFDLHSQEIDWDRNITIFNQRINRDPNDFVAYNGRGYAYENKGDYDRAISDYEAALRIDPSSSWTKDNLERVRKLKQGSSVTQQPQTNNNQQRSNTQSNTQQQQSQPRANTQQQQPRTNTQQQQQPRSNAQTTNPASDFIYDLNREGNGIVIKRYIGNSPNVVIPQRIEGYPVVEIGSDAFAYDYRKSDLNPIGTRIYLNSIVIPEGVRIIGSGAFSLQSRIRNITFPSTLRVIGRGAFQKLAEDIGSITIRLPDSVESIGSYAFNNANLSSINIPANIRRIENDAFSTNWGHRLSNLIIPNNIRSIQWGTPMNHFSGQNGLPLATRQRLRQLGYTGGFER